VEDALFLKKPVKIELVNEAQIEGDFLYRFPEKDKSLLASMINLLLMACEAVMP